MQYLPGWWDQLGGSVTGFVDQAQKAISPNHYAQKNLQQLIQQDPTILMKIAEMSPEQRNLAAQGMGFRNQNPFEKIPEGPQLSDRKRREVERSSLTKTQQ